MAGTSRITILNDDDESPCEGTISSGWSNISSIHGGRSNKGEGRPAPEPIVGDDDIEVDMESEEEDDDKVVAEKAPPRVSSTPKSDTNLTISIRTNILDELEHYFAKNRSKVINPETGFMSTPLHCVKLLSDKFDTNLHSEVYIIHHGIRDMQGEDRIYRVELLCGKARGIGQAPLKGLAHQLAAVDLLEKIKYFNNDKLIEYGLPPGCRINPRVVHELFNLTNANNLRDPEIEIIPSSEPFENRELYDCVITIGQVEVRASSDSRHMARRIAARDMYNYLSQNPWPEMHVAIGGECLGFKILRELGVDPIISDTKREWLKTYRSTDEGKVLFFLDEEPDDGQMLDNTDVAMVHVTTTEMEKKPDEEEDKSDDKMDDA